MAIVARKKWAGFPSALHRDSTLIFATRATQVSIASGVLLPQQDYQFYPVVPTFTWRAKTLRGRRRIPHRSRAAPGLAIGRGTAPSVRYWHLRATRLPSKYLHQYRRQPSLHGTSVPSSAVCQAVALREALPAQTGTRKSITAGQKRIVGLVRPVSQFP